MRQFDPDIKGICSDVYGPFRPLMLGYADDIGLMDVGFNSLGLPTAAPICH